MKFSVMFWNVENFGRSIERGDPQPSRFEERVDQVADHIQNLNVDMLCLCEIRDRVALRSLLMDRLVKYDFAITDSSGNIELLTGWKRGKFEQILFTQRRQFQVSSTFLRPGAFCSVKFEGEFFNFLFLHTDSGTEARDYDNRQSMFEKIWHLRQTLDDISRGDAKFVVMGDLNTMGREKPGSLPPISAEQEIAGLEQDAQGNGMQMLLKTHNNTWRYGPRCPNFESNLDHVLATPNVSFEVFQYERNENPIEVRVDGWNHLEGEERDNFTMNVSDHCSIFCTVLST